MKQIEKDINQYENKVLTEARTIFHENEKMLLKETLEHESEVRIFFSQTIIQHFFVIPLIHQE